jgi:hypothetical protein
MCGLLPALCLPLQVLLQRPQTPPLPIIVVGNMACIPAPKWKMIFIFGAGFHANNSPKLLVEPAD